MGNFRELWISLIFGGVAMTVFMGFVIFGWPGEANDCVDLDDCYCERFDPNDIGEPGVLQPSNTWSNLSSLILAAGMALAIGLDRRCGRLNGPGRMKSDTVYPLVLCLILTFMGPGSMFYHASMTAWGGNIDGLSMYLLSSFVMCYGVARLINNAASPWVFGFAYPTFTALFATLHSLGVNSEILVPIGAGTGGAIELYFMLRTPVAKLFSSSSAAARTDTTGSTVWGVVAFWLGLALFIFAMISRELSKTGGPWCDPEAAFQGHALWHILSYGMVHLLYWYYRGSRR